MKPIVSFTGATLIVLVSVFSSAAAPPASNMLGQAPEGMAYIPAGEFIMGHDGKNLDATMGVEPADEMPERKLNLKPFYMDKYEVTNKNYKDYLDGLKEKGIKAFSHYEDDGVPVPDRWSLETYPPDEDNNPVVDVDWYMAGKYCESLGKRLPTEEEWEKAARGADKRTFPWGNKHKAGYANNREYWEAKKADNDSWRVLPVGSFPKDVSAYGVYDMAGNAFEWTSSLYRPYPGSKLTRDTFNMEIYVLRGGAFNALSHEYGRTTSRYSRKPTDAHSAHAEWHTDMNIGFRCAKDAE